MKKEDFIKLHLNLKVCIDKSIIVNPLPSATDPTQDIPVRNIEVSALGVPLNVKEVKGVFSNLKIEQFTTIEKRNNDKFDVVAELQSSATSLQGKGVTTNYKIPKKQKSHETEKNN